VHWRQLWQRGLSFDDVLPYFRAPKIRLAAASATCTRRCSSCRSRHGQLSTGGGGVGGGGKKERKQPIARTVIDGSASAWGFRALTTHRACAGRTSVDIPATHSNGRRWLTTAVSICAFDEAAATSVGSPMR